MTELDEKAIASRWSLLRGALNEAQRRLWLGLEAHLLGGRDRGVSALARATNSSPQIVRDGLELVDNLLSGAEIPDAFHPHVRVRREGGGRKSLREKYPELVPTLMELVEPERVLGRSSPLLWAIKTREQLVEELAARGFQVSGSSVLELLRQEGFRVGRAYSRRHDANRPQPRDQYAFVSQRVAFAQCENQPVVAMNLLRVSRAAQLTDGAAGIAAHLRRRRDDRFFEDEDAKPTPVARCEVCGATKHQPGELKSPSTETIDFAALALEQWWRHEVAASPSLAERLVVVVAGLDGDEQDMRRLRSRLAVARQSLKMRLEILHMPAGIFRWRSVPRKFTLATNDYVVNGSLARHEVQLELPGSPRDDVDRRDGLQSSTGAISDRGMPVSIDGFARYPIWNYALAYE